MVPKFLLKTTEEYWLTDINTVKKFHNELQQDAIQQNYQLTNFSYAEKPIKEGKEIVDSYFIVKVTKIFDDAKEPINTPMETINYQRINSDGQE